MVAYCKGCNAKIRWVKTIAGKNMPVEINQIPVLMPTKSGTVPADDQRYEMITGYKPHWIDCEARDQFRKPKGTKQNGRKANGGSGPGSGTQEPTA